MCLVRVRVLYISGVLMNFVVMWLFVVCMRVVRWVFVVV